MLTQAGRRRLVATLFLSLLPAAAAPPARGEAEDDGSFGLTAPVVCREINGYEDYVPSPDASLTADEKLLIYYRPRHYKSEAVEGRYRTRLTQDARITRKGEKATLWSKPRIVDYEVVTDQPPRTIFIRNAISLKGLRPGDYELEVVLRDEVGRGAPATRTVPFRVVAAKDPGGPDAPGPR